MVISSSNIYSDSNPEVIKINSANKKKLQRLHKRQIQIYHLCTEAVISSLKTLRNAAIGRKVLLS